MTRDEINQEFKRYLALHNILCNCGEPSIQQARGDNWDGRHAPDCNIETAWLHVDYMENKK